MCVARPARASRPGDAKASLGRNIVARAARACWAVSSEEQRLAKTIGSPSKSCQISTQASADASAHQFSNLTQVKSERRAAPGSPTDQLRGKHQTPATMGAGASAETKITKSDALMAVHEAFHGKGDGELSIQEIVPRRRGTPKTAPASSQDWSAPIAGAAGPSVAARYAAEHRKASMTLGQPLALQDEGAMFRLVRHPSHRRERERHRRACPWTCRGNQWTPVAAERDPCWRAMFTLARQRSPDGAVMGRGRSCPSRPPCDQPCPFIERRARLST